MYQISYLECQSVPGGWKATEPDRLVLSWSVWGPTNNFWPDDPACSQYRTRLLVNHSLQTRALVSYPGSGNTWIRYLALFTNIM